jgi:hypothetical protein
MPRNQAGLTASELATAWARIKAAARRFNIEVSEETGKTAKSVAKSVALNPVIPDCVAMALQSMIEEIEAAALYDARIQSLDARSDKPAHAAQLVQILQHNRDEEHQHAEDLLDWIAEHVKEDAARGDILIY